MKCYLSKSLLKDKNFQLFEYPADVDMEMVDLLDVFNNIPGLRTMFSYCGHGCKGAWYISFNCCSFEIENIIASWFSKNGYLIHKNGVYNPKDLIHEYGISVYGHKVKLRTEEDRFKEYKRIVRHFSKYIPRKHW